MSLRVATYVRISSDVRDDEAGVERQRADARKLADAHGWTIVAEHGDNDLSATKGAPRPGYEALVALVAAGQIEQVVVWQTSRLWRNRGERAAGIGLFARHGVGIKAVKGPDLDLSTAYGRGMAGLLGEFDTMESEVKSERIVAALAQNGAEGRPHGPAAYGWARTHDAHRRPVDVVDEAQAAVVREMAERIIAGDSLRGIVGDLNARGIPSPTGRPWGKQMVRHVVTRERNVAQRRHHGAVLGPAAWEPILDVGIWEQVRAVLADPSRRTSSGSAAKHLLSGLARCGVCEGPMRGSQNRDVASYKCADRSCVSRNRRDVDRLVTKAVTGRLARLDPTEFADAARQDDARQAAQDAAALRARLDLAADSYAAGEIDQSQLTRITAKLRPQIEAAQAKAGALDHGPLLAGLAGRPDVEAVWSQLPLSRQRAIVDLLVEVRILKTQPGARVFDPECVAVSWRR